MLRSHRLALSVACLALAACSTCGKRGPGGAPAEVARFLPRAATAAVVVPDLGALGQKLTLLEGLKVASFAAQLQGMADAHEYASALMGQLGVDLRSREAIANAGIDPDRKSVV